MQMFCLLQQRAGLCPHLVFRVTHRRQLSQNCSDQS
jgi:hypothetical protein